MSGQPPGVAQAHFCHTTFLAHWQEALLLLWIPLEPGNGRENHQPTPGCVNSSCRAGSALPQGRDRGITQTCRTLRDPCSEAELPLVSQGLLQRINPQSYRHSHPSASQPCSLPGLPAPQRAFS